jgi:hypothetical protein
MTFVVIDMKLTMPGSRTADLQFSPPSKEQIDKSIPASAVVCTATGQCDKASASVFLRQVTRKKASGRFSFVFPNGHKEDGVFEAVHKKQPKLKCE